MFLKNGFPDFDISILTSFGAMDAYSEANARRPDLPFKKDSLESAEAYLSEKVISDSVK